MDAKLKDRLERWHKQIERVRVAELECFQFEAQEKSLFAQLFLKNDTGSIVEKECKAYACLDWINFKNGLAASKSNLNNEKRLLELTQSAFQAEYLEAKFEGEAVQKWPKSVS